MSRVYKGRSVDLKQIGRELNVRYVLEGSVQRAANRMRVGAQLIDAESGAHLWAERFDRPLADLFDMQDEIVARLANALTAPIVTAEARRAERTPDPDSMDLCFQGRSWWNKGLTPDGLDKARGFFERAAALDPSSPYALLGVATVDAVIAINFFADNRAALLAAAEAALAKALSLAPELAAAYLTLGFIQFHTGRAAQGVMSCERALELDRNLAQAHGQLGSGKIHLGRPEETEAHIHEALRLSPRDTYVYLWRLFAGLAKLHLGEDEKAVVWLRRAVEANRSFPAARVSLAAALALLGRLDEARSEAQAALAMNPSFTIARFRAGASSENAAVAAARERYMEGLRLAGVPEQ